VTLGSGRLSFSRLSVDFGRFVAVTCYEFIAAALILLAGWSRSPLHFFQRQLPNCQSILPTSFKSIPTSRPQSNGGLAQPRERWLGSATYGVSPLVSNTAVIKPYTVNTLQSAPGKIIRAGVNYHF
jgi:hypothetical protein